MSSNSWRPERNRPCITFRGMPISSIRVHFLVDTTYLYCHQVTCLSMDPINLIRVLKIPPFFNDWIYQLSITPLTCDLLGDAFVCIPQPYVSMYLSLKSFIAMFCRFLCVSLLWSWGYSLCFTFSMLLQLELS